jgi:hypothetical protein
MYLKYGRLERESRGLNEQGHFIKTLLKNFPFHRHHQSKTEHGVKQEMYAHLLLIKLSRFFEFDAKDDLPPMRDDDKEKCAVVNFYKIFNPRSMFNINFKNCLSIVGRYIEKLVLAAYDQLNQWTPKLIHMMLRVRQKIRPGRSYPRHSHKPAKKWGAKGTSTSDSY